jgi:hypothetical protein
MENDTDIQRERETKNETHSTAQILTRAHKKSQAKKKKKTKQTNCDIFFIHVLIFNTK